MAVTKTHPIKSTLKAAIDYICNPEKTDGKLLVSAYGCAAETADIEFAWTRRHAIDKGTNLGRHLIQAFQPGEVTPEQAHKIGMELAREILGGRYEFVLTTHTDRDHVHNHLIFNAVSFEDHKHYHSNKRSYHFIRRTSDRICKEHGLSVIVPGQDKGKSYIEHQAERAGTSYKAKLRAAIDRLLPGCHDLEALLIRLQREGYEFKRGKYISARAPGQERFTRLKTLGADYAEDAHTKFGVWATFVDEADVLGSSMIFVPVAGLLVISLILTVFIVISSPVILRNLRVILDSILTTYNCVTSG